MPIRPGRVQESISSPSPARTRSEPSRRNAHIAAAILLFFGIYFYIVAISAAIARALDPTLLLMIPERRAPIIEVLASHGAAGALCLIGFLVVRRRSVRSRVPRLLLLFSPLILLVSADRVVNVLWPPPLPRPGIFRRDARRGWAHVPGTVSEDWYPAFIDQYGLRVPESEWAREFGDGPRILFLGDSLTFGYALPAEQCFVEVAAQRLAQRPESPPWIVLNGGITGYDPAQEYILLTEKFDEWRPDLIVLQFCLNDVTRQFEAGRADNSDRHGEFSLIRRDPNPSAFVRMARDWGRRRSFGKDLQAAAEHIEHFEMSVLLEQKESDEIRALWDRMLGNADKIVAFCREKDVPLGVLIFPVELQMADPQASLHPLRRLREFAEKHELPALELLPVLEADMPRGPAAAKALFIDVTHPTRRGHALIGAAVVDFLDESGLLMRGRARWQRRNGP